MFTGTTNGHSGNANSFTYQYHGDPRATFAQFFGSSNPFGSFFDMSDNLFDKSVFDNTDTDTDFFSPFGGLGQRHGLGGAFRYVNSDAKILCIQKAMLLHLLTP